MNWFLFWKNGNGYEVMAEDGWTRPYIPFPFPGPGPGEAWILIKATDIINSRGGRGGEVESPLLAVWSLTGGG